MWVNIAQGFQLKIAIISPATTLAARLLDTTVESNTIINIVDYSSAGEQLRTTKPDIIVIEHINDQQEMFALCRDLKAEPDYHFIAVILSDIPLLVTSTDSVSSLYPPDEIFKSGLYCFNLSM